MKLTEADALAYQIAKQIAFTRLGVTDCENLLGYLLEYYASNTRVRLELGKADKQIYAFLHRSFLQLCKNYARDIESPLSRQVQDLSQAIKRLQAKGLSRQSICEELCICPARLNYISQLNLSRYNVELTEWCLPVSSTDNYTYAELACMGIDKLEALQESLIKPGL